VYRAHLVGDRADSADPRRNVGRLGEGAATQKGFEEARRLEYSELGAMNRSVAHDHLDRAFAFDASEIVHFDGLNRHGARFPRETALRWR
jgi:hypothetical protein